MKKRKISKYGWFLIICIFIIVLFNLLAMNRGFCDFYTDSFYRVWANTYGRFMGIFPFSVGEILVLLMIIAVMMALVFGVILIFLRKKAKYRGFCKVYYKVMLSLILITGILMTLNCSIPYNCSTLEFDKPKKNEYSDEEFAAVYNLVVENCNRLYKEVKRDEQGVMVLPGDVQQRMKTALRNLSEEYSRLRGYYPNAKPIFNSYIMDQSGTIGVYFPFSLEANYSRYLSSAFLPSVIGHELAHLKGYMYENEANFIAYLACIGSDSKEIQYSGYISVLIYLEDYVDTIDKKLLVKCNENVWKDAVYYTKEATEEIKNKKEVIKTEVVEKFEEKFTATYMDYYGVTANYEDVVLLMLNYYDGKLY